ncbi:EAL domain-containing protein [Ruminococcaceae bacterium OttesenSCG-928-L11]|nr:EAL domain-containing protein [Ruminococcaceae bacterium OttesenSCG-928-L11]
MKRTLQAGSCLLCDIPGLDRLKNDLCHVCTCTETVCFLCYDIETLHRVNRAYGRCTGDALLEAVAEWVGRFSDGELYRVEGDQFCILFRNVELKRVRQYADELELRFGQPWLLTVEEREISVFSQVIIAVLGELNCDIRLEVRDLLDQAIELSRKNHHITVFDAGCDKQSRDHVRLQVELKSDILSGMRGFDVHYQPIVDPSTSTWRGLEALCRWTSPSFGPIPPDRFIQEAEEMGLIHILGDWVLDTALATCKRMGLDELDGFFVSVNVSALQMVKQNYVQTVLDAVHRHDYPFHRLLLEITESTRFPFGEVTYSVIEALRSTGIMLALDDFGTGYSGFSYLKNLPTDILKTDRDFVRDIETDTYLQYFYFVMSETAHANQMKLIAEGVETRAQLRSVVKNGADLIQGYLFGKPMDSPTIESMKDNFTVPLEVFSEWMTDMVDFKHWIHSQDAYKITPSLFGLQSKCIDLILEQEDPELAIHRILETVGTHFKVNHVYVFLRDESTIFSNRYEWCAQGSGESKHLFQRVDGSTDGFYDLLCENEIIIATNASQLPRNLRERLEQGNKQDTIQSIVAMPMKQHGEILGFVGFDCGSERRWVPEELIILHNLCLFCLIIMEKSKERPLCGPERCMGCRK